LIYSHKYLRNPFTREEQQKIRLSEIAIAGLGGTGGFILESLLRAGAENLLLFEDDSVELSNFNRQLLATDQFLDRPKSEAAAARAKQTRQQSCSLPAGSGVIRTLETPQLSSTALTMLRQSSRYRKRRGKRKSRSCSVRPAITAA
jgi:tRNA A37 threonylcarbamoyladenosine dehydratase